MGRKSKFHCVQDEGSSGCIERKRDSVGASQEIRCSSQTDHRLEKGVSRKVRIGIWRGTFRKQRTEKPEGGK